MVQPAAGCDRCRNEVVGRVVVGSHVGEAHGVDGRMDRVLGAAYHAPYGTPLGPGDVRVEELAREGAGGCDGAGCFGVR